MQQSDGSGSEDQASVDTQTSVVVETLLVRAFRNIGELELHPAERINVISGDNGQGKTSLLEALYFAATSKSFRTEKARELIQS